jgi:hypothetical protein
MTHRANERPKKKEERRPKMLKKKGKEDYKCKDG